MKRLIPLILIICMMLTSCMATGIVPETTTEEATTEPVIYRNPLNGEIISEPYSGRVFSVSINNVKPALPFKGINDADVFFEMFVNDYCTRGLALYTDISDVAHVGSIRSTRYNFTDISLAYDTVMCFSGGSDSVIKDMKNSGIDYLFVDVPVGYRDTDRSAQGYAYEHTLFAVGENLKAAAEDAGFRLSVTDRNYGMSFADEACPVNGTLASSIEIVFTINGVTKTTVMEYDALTDKYVFNQYGKEMSDIVTGTLAAFSNVIIMLAPTRNEDVYHIADLYSGGDGYFACGGRLVPIRWSHTGETVPFTFTLTDGTPLVQEAGNTYIAIAPTGSPVNIISDGTPLAQ